MNTKRAVIFHGTSGSPADHWLPWMEQKFEKSGYDVYAPILPANDTPNKDTYEAFLKNSGWDFTGNVLVGHSSGATTILNLLSADWFPHVKAVVLVATFLNEKWTKDASWSTPGQFDDLFLPAYDPAVLNLKASVFYFVHSDEDPYCDIEDARRLSDGLGGRFLTIPGGHHLGDSSGRTELPELEDLLRDEGILNL